MDINITLVIQGLAFFAVAWVVMKFGWPHIMSAIEERQAKIADGLAAADRSKKDLASAEEKVNEVLREARGKANEIIAQAEARRIQIIDDAKGEAANEGLRLKAGAEAEIGHVAGAAAIARPVEHDTGFPGADLAGGEATEHRPVELRPVLLGSEPDHHEPVGLDTGRGRQAQGRLRLALEALAGSGAGHEIGALAAQGFRRRSRQGEVVAHEHHEVAPATLRRQRLKGDFDPTGHDALRFPPVVPAALAPRA